MSEDAALVRLEGVSKRFLLQRETSLKTAFATLLRRRPDLSDREFWVLKNVSFSVGPGESLGIIGRNGSGKSTALRIVAGILRADAGSVHVSAHRVAPLLELGAGFHPDLTGRENIYLNGAILGLDKLEISAIESDVIAFSELDDFIDEPVRHYSSGMYMRLGFAVAAHTNPDLLLVDEAFAVGDEFFQKRCTERIERFRNDGVGIVLVSHSLEMVCSYCERTVWLNEGSVEMESASSEVVEAYLASGESAPAG